MNYVYDYLIGYQLQKLNADKFSSLHIYLKKKSDFTTSF